MHLQRLFLFFLFSIVWLSAFGQGGPPRRGSSILDDTTKQVYGPRTTRYYYEKDAFYNRPLTYFVDTIPTNFHRFTYPQRTNFLYQDLGNIGTAIRPIYYQAPETIGVRSGFDVYDLYWDTEAVQHFDSRSPHSNMQIIWGGRGRSMTRAIYTRNISPRWNFGFKYRGLFIDKQIPERRGKGDRITRDNYYDLFSSFNTKDSTYRAFFSFRRMFHRVNEFGGVRVSTDTLFEDNEYGGYFVENPRGWLTSVETNDLRMNFHFAHEAKLARALQVYHALDRYRQNTKFLARNSVDGIFYPFKNVARDTIGDLARYRIVRNEFGIKGNLLKLFYNGYYAIRHYNMRYINTPVDSVPIRGNEIYYGGRMELALDSIGSVGGWVEVNNNGNYRIQGNITSRWFEASARQMLYRPAFAQQIYYGGYNQWSNDFDNIDLTQLSGYVHYRSRVLSVSPGVSFTRLRNYVYFKENDRWSKVTQRVSPVQSSGNQIYAAPELKLSLTVLKHINLTTQVIYTSFLENAEEALRIPKTFVNAQLAYANIFVHGNLDMQAGLDVHYQSAYKPQAYDPATRQFYNQDTFTAEAFPLVDVFFNARIKRGRVFFKYNNLMQAFTRSGYFFTPYYPGQRNIIDFGFDWHFFD